MAKKLPDIHAKVFGILEYSVLQMGRHIKVQIKVESGIYGFIATGTDPARS